MSLERRALADLEAAPRDLPDVFELDLGGEALQVQAVHRWLPGRRLTATVNGNRVLKLFIGAKAASYMARERAGLEAFVSAGLPTPAVVSAGEHWLMFEELPDVRRAAAADIEPLADALARLHEAGFGHDDLHVGNFLFSADTLYLVDGDGIGAPPSDPLQQLAVLVVQFSVMEQDLAERALACYCAARSLTADHEQFAEQVLTARRRRVLHYLAKSRRTCTEFEVVQRAGARLACRRAELDAGEVLLERAAELLAEAPQRLKEGGSATVARVHIAGRSWILKRYNIKSFTHRLRRVFKPRPRRAWEHTLMFEFLGLPTACAAALVETGPRWWPGPAYLLLEDLGDDHLAALTEDDTWQPDWLPQMLALLEGMRAAEVSHGDFKATNFVRQDGQLHVIDLDGVQMDAEGLGGDVARFAANWPEGSTVREEFAEAIVRRF